MHLHTHNGNGKNSALPLLLLLLLSLPHTNAWTTTPSPHLPLTTLHSTPPPPTSSSSSNIVFRPCSEDPTAFDSFKIGTPRIHRYSSPMNDDSEYIMWYHGRRTPKEGEGEEEEEEGAPLPPLSTGRIGRATSRNGLAWKRSSIGSASETSDDDGDGTSGAVVLGPNKEEWWSFDTSHVGLGQVMLPLTTPAVMTDGGVYLMYYMGGNWDEMELAEFLPPSSSSGSGAGGVVEGKVSGMGMRIGVALSQDGTTFGRVEGDDPTGAVVTPYDSSVPRDGNDDGGYGRADLEEELYCAWPDVVVNSDADRRRNDKRGFLMYYSTMVKETKEKAIGLAMSADGFRWFQRGICLRPSPKGEEGTSSVWDDAGCARSTIVRNATYNEDTQTWSLLDDWIMFYEGVSSSDGKHRILTATSDDGVRWTKKEGRGMVALDVGEDGAWDSGGVGSACIVRLDDGSVRMYYTGVGEGGETAIGVAKCGVGEDIAGGGDGEGEGFVRENISWAAW